jgi:hypothetical protein
MSDIIDINVAQTVEEVTINVTEEVIQVNINQVNGGGSQTLNETLINGNATDGEDIFLSDGDSILLDNGSKLKKGTTNAGNGGNNGIALKCSLDYEFKWEAGRMYIMQQDGVGIRETRYNFNVAPTVNDDDTKGYAIDSRWILDNGDLYICTDATTDDAVWELQSTISTLQEVLDNNHDLVDGNNFQGTEAGLDNTGTNVIAFGNEAAINNTGDNVNVLGDSAGQYNIANNVNAMGLDAARSNSGEQVNAMGEEAGLNNTFNNVNLFGQSATADEDGQTVLSKDGTIMARISTNDLTNTQKYNLPNASGTIALTTDIVSQVNSDWNATSGVAEILNKPTIPSSATFVPYTGATANVDLGTHKLLAKDLDINHTSGSGDAATITKGGSGEALKVVKSSGSGNAASITGGVTLLDELHLTTDLADAYIASASTWNAKQNLVSLYNLTSQVTHTGTTAKTIITSYFIPANTFTNGDFLTFSALVTKVANINITTHTLEINTTNTLTGATIISTAGFNTTNFSMKFKREMALNGGNIYLLNINNATTNDQTIGTVINGMSTFTYNLAADLYFFVTCQLNNATDSITYRGVSITKN